MSDEPKKEPNMRQMTKQDVIQAVATPPKAKKPDKECSPVTVQVSYQNQDGIWLHDTAPCQYIDRNWLDAFSGPALDLQKGDSLTFTLTVKKVTRKPGKSGAPPPMKRP